MKAILVVDMPNNCEECRLYDNESQKCTALWKYYLIGEWTDECRTLLEDGQCPLKLIPQKLSVDDMSNAFGWNKSFDEKIKELTYMKYMAMGYNACLEEIMGETE